MEIILQPIAIVKNARTEPIDDHWEAIVAEIELADHIPSEVFNNITDFSHLEVIYFFNRVKIDDIVYSGRPRGNPEYLILPRNYRLIDRQQETARGCHEKQKTLPN
jgi:tRNA (Thr-GGU) A37 N-methylase